MKKAQVFGHNARFGARSWKGVRSVGKPSRLTFPSDTLPSQAGPRSNCGVDGPKGQVPVGKPSRLAPEEAVAEEVRRDALPTALTREVGLAENAEAFPGQD
jgi:hypothetical protein